MSRTYRRMTSMLLSIPLFKWPGVAETDLNRRFDHLSHILDARTQHPTRPRPPTTLPSGPSPPLSTYLPLCARIRQNHATCFGCSHTSTLHIRLRRSGWWLAKQRASAARTGCASQRAPYHTCSPPTPCTVHPETIGNTRTRTMMMK